MIRKSIFWLFLSLNPEKVPALDIWGFHARHRGDIQSTEFYLFFSVLFFCNIYARLHHIDNSIKLTTRGDVTRFEHPYIFICFYYFSLLMNESERRLAKCSTCLWILIDIEPIRKSLWVNSRLTTTEPLEHRILFLLYFPFFTHFLRVTDIQVFLPTVDYNGPTVYLSVWQYNWLYDSGYRTAIVRPSQIDSGWDSRRIRV